MASVHWFLQTAPCTSWYIIILAGAAPLSLPSVTCLQVHNEKGKHRVVVTKNLPGERWLNVLKAANCRVEICTHEATILDNDTIVKLIGDDCMGVLGQLTEVSHFTESLHRSTAAPVGMRAPCM